MANPQKEDGHVSVANDIWEALCRTDISGKHRRVFDAIIRKTWGWNKKEDAIPISQLVERTGINRRTVIYCLQDLEAKRMIFVRRGGDGMNRDINRMSINKDFEMWAVQNSAPQTEKNRNLAKISSAKLRKQKEEWGGSAKLGKKAVQNYVSKVRSFALSKDTTSKDTISKDMHPPINGGEHGYPVLKSHSSDQPIAKVTKAEIVGEELIIQGERIRTPVEQVMDAFHLTVNPTINYGNTTQRRAADLLVKQIGLDKVLAAIKFIHEVASQDHYAPTITTPFQLREKFGSLVSYAHKKQNKGGGGSINLDNV